MSRHASLADHLVHTAFWFLTYEKLKSIEKTTELTCRATFTAFSPVQVDQLNSCMHQDTQCSCAV